MTKSGAGTVTLDACIGDVWTRDVRLGDLRRRRVDWETRRGRGIHESGSLSHRTLSREARRCGARLREDSPRCGTVRMRTRGRDKQTSPDFCT